MTAPIFFPRFALPLCTWTSGLILIGCLPAFAADELETAAPEPVIAGEQADAEDVEDPEEGMIRVRGEMQAISRRIVDRKRELQAQDPELTALAEKVAKWEGELKKYTDKVPEIAGLDAVAGKTRRALSEWSVNSEDTPEWKAEYVRLRSQVIEQAGERRQKVEWVHTQDPVAAKILDEINMMKDTLYASLNADPAVKQWLEEHAELKEEYNDLYRKARWR